MRAQASSTYIGAGRMYAALGILFALTMITQVSFTVDLVRAWNGDYPGRPVSLGSPWPTITGVGDSAAAAGLRAGDRVVSIEGRTLRGLMDLEQPVRQKHPGQSIHIAVLGKSSPVSCGPPTSSRPARRSTTT